MHILKAPYSDKTFQFPDFKSQARSEHGQLHSKQNSRTSDLLPLAVSPFQVPALG